MLAAKDEDFVEMVERLGPPPQVIWLTCGNTSNVALRSILKSELLKALVMLGKGERLVEISGAP